MKGEDPARAIRNELRFELDRARKITSDLCRMLDHVRAMYKPCPDCVFDAAMAEALSQAEAKCEKYRAAPGRIHQTQEYYFGSQPTADPERTSTSGGRVEIRSTDLRMWSHRAWQRYRRAWQRIKEREQKA